MQKTPPKNGGADKFIAITNDVNCRPCLWEKRQTSCSDLKCLHLDLNKIINLLVVFN